MNPVDTLIFSSWHTARHIIILCPLSCQSQCQSVHHTLRKVERFFCQIRLFNHTTIIKFQSRFFINMQSTCFPIYFPSKENYPPVFVIVSLMMMNVQVWKYRPVLSKVCLCGPPWPEKWCNIPQLVLNSHTRHYSYW